MSRCLGCGVRLQTVDETKIGYVPNHVIEEKGEAYCLRCHTLLHHNKAVMKMPAFNEEYYKKIGKIKDEKALVLLLIDCLDLYNGFIDHLKEYIGNNPVLILITKIDLLPKDLKKERLVERVFDIAKNEQLNVIKVIPISAKSSINMRQVINQIGDYRLKYQFKNSNVYCLGCSNVGKSTFINRLFKELGDDEHPILTTSDQNQTTLDLIKIPIQPKGYLFDTPGVVKPSNFGAHLSYDSMKVLTPKNYLKVRTYQLYDEQTLLLGGLIRLDIPKGDVISLAFFVSNDLYIHRTKTIKADELIKTQLGKILSPPIDEIDFAFTTKTIEIDFDGCDTDIFISGLGFIHITGSSRIIHCTLPIDIDLKIVPGVFS